MSVSPPYRLRGLARILRGMLLVLTIGTAVLVPLTFWVVRVVVEMMRGTAPIEETQRQLALLNPVLLPVSNIVLVLLFACYLVSGIWIYRATANASAIAPRHDRIRPGWAVGWYFIPFAGLVMPYRAMRQSWNTAMEPARSISDSGEPAWFFVWWVCFIGSNILGRIGDRMAESDNPDTLSAAGYVTVVGLIAGVIATWLWRRIVGAVSDGLQRAPASTQEVAA